MLLSCFVVCFIAIFGSQIFSIHGLGEIWVGEPKQNNIPIDYVNGEFSTSKMTVEQVLDILYKRYQEKLRQSRQPRRLLEGSQEKRIAEICGTSSSFVCGEDVLIKLNFAARGTADENVQLKCNVRKDFLNCIDEERRNCKELAEKGVFPQLPPKAKVLEIQDEVWHSLWTSGGCLLGN